MSATMDVDLFSEYFNKSPVLYLEGRQHPIQIYYTKQTQSDYLQAALVSIFQIHQVVVSIFGRETLLLLEMWWNKIPDKKRFLISTHLFK